MFYCVCLRRFSLAPLQSSWVSTATVARVLSAIASPIILHAHTAPLYAADSPTAIDGEYVVILKEELSDSDGMDILCLCDFN